MAKNPSFKLYRIVRKSDGRGFSGFCGSRDTWTLQGTFYRKPETIRKHLTWITCDKEFYQASINRYGWRIIKQNPEKYEDYYIESFRVNILDDPQRAEAAVFAGIRKDKPHD